MTVDRHAFELGVHAIHVGRRRVLLYDGMVTNLGNHQSVAGTIGDIVSTFHIGNADTVSGQIECSGHGQRVVIKRKLLASEHGDLVLCCDD